MQSRVITATLLLLALAASAAAAEPLTCAGPKNLFIGGEGCTRPIGAINAPKSIVAACRAGLSPLQPGQTYSLRCCTGSCFVSNVEFPISAPQCSSCPGVVAAGARCNEINCSPKGDENDTTGCTAMISNIECPVVPPPATPPPMVPPPATPPPATPPPTTPPPATPPPATPPPATPPPATPPPATPPPPPRKHFFGNHQKRSHFILPTGPLFQKRQKLIARLRQRKEALLAELSEIDMHMG